MRSLLLPGDCRDSMRFCVADGEVDSVVTDPPYELGFMGRSWDSTGIANDVEVWRQAFRALKPGGHLLAFSGTRTYHRMVCAIEDAGFEIRDQIGWVYGSGFPKSLDVSKAIDGHTTTGRSDSLTIKDVNETRPGQGVVRPSSTNGHRGIVGAADAGSSVKRDTPATDAARQWQGWGTALKPAWEPICVARKPLIGTVAANVLAHGTGALNIDGCRVESADGTGTARVRSLNTSGVFAQDAYTKTMLRCGNGSHIGRWPANLIHDGSPEVVALFPDSTGRGHSPRVRGAGGISTNGHGGQDGLMEQDFGTGSVARFFYCAKTSKKDRGYGNDHPTVKPTDLMRYLCRLVTPPGGTVLDPFAGSGSTGKAALLEGFNFIGCELNDDYIALARSRIESARLAA